MSSQFISFKMVIEILDILRVRWNSLNDFEKSEISIHLGHLPSIMDFKVWAIFINIITQFWDDKRMVFWFGDVKITSTIEKIKDCLHSIVTCDKRKKYPNHHILLTARPTSAKLKGILLLVDADWLDSQNIPLMWFFERWGHDIYFRLFPKEFHNHSTWR